MSETISYWEKRQINIGNYENIEYCLSIGENYKSFNNTDNTITITHSEKARLDSTAIDQQALRLMKRTKKILDAKEVDIRTKSAKFTDFKTLDKAVFSRIIGWAKLKLRVSKLQSEVDEEFEAIDNTEDF